VVVHRDQTAGRGERLDFPLGRGPPVSIRTQPLRRRPSIRTVYTGQYARQALVFKPRHQASGAFSTSAAPMISVNCGRSLRPRVVLCDRLLRIVGAASAPL
jgi:hypothetical protein